MRFLNDLNKKAVKDHIFGLLKDLKAMRNGLDLNGDGINWVGDAALAAFDHSGKIDLRRVIELADEARGYAPLREDYPHPSDKNLDWMRSIEDICECPVEKFRRFSQEAAKAESTRDESRKTLYERFNERCSWLHANNVHRPKKEEAPQTPKQLTAKEQAAAKVKAEIDAIKAEIDAATKGYTNWTIRQREKLHARFTELLADMPRAKFFDRYGSQEWLTGWPAVQRIIREEVRDANNPIR